MVKGEEISIYEVEKITLNTATKEAKYGVLQGQKAKYAIVTARDIESFLAKPCKIFLFQEDFEKIINTLEMYVDDSSTDHLGGKMVDLDKLANDPIGKNLLTLYGIQSVRRPLKKGMCYCNDKDGNLVIDKWGNPVIRDSVNVVCQIDHINDDGTEIYYPGRDPETMRDHIESHFFRKTVS